MGALLNLRVGTFVNPSPAGKGTPALFVERANGCSIGSPTSPKLIRDVYLGEDPRLGQPVVDRPFHFFIMDKPTGTVVFAGRVTDPKS